MNLPEFFNRFKIDTDALARIKDRVFVVGRFNQRSKGAPPEVFLFTKRGDLSVRYRENFQNKTAYNLSYEDFVRALAPAVAERVKRLDHQRFHAVEHVIPDGSDATEGAAVIDPFNYFFGRAVAHSNQTEFASESNSSTGGSDLLSPGEEERGKGILTQIRKNLGTFCSFQPRTHEIVDLFSKYLAECAARLDITIFADGDALPPGFSGELINFLYLENESARFALNRLDLTGTNWRTLWDNGAQKPTASGDKLISVVCAFRDALLKVNGDQFGAIKVGGKNLNRVAEESVASDEKLAKGFRNSRFAFNGLRQILRSRVLLSMVLEWLLGEYRKLPEVAAKQKAGGQDRALEDAILDRWKENGLAKPVRRPSPAERARFSDILTENYELLLDGVVGSDKEFEDVLKKLPGELGMLAKEIRADVKQRDALSKIAGKNQSPELQKAFRDATKIVLLDVMCPVLYRVPVLSVQHLRKYLRQEVLSSYLTAVFLSDKDQDKVRRIAEEQLDYFESQIDKATQRITNEGPIQAKLLKGYLAMLASPEMEARLSKDIAMLYNVLALLDSEHAIEGLGVGGIVPKRVSEPTSEDLERSAELTDVSRAPIKEAIEAKVRAFATVRYSELVQAAAARAGASMEPSDGAGATRQAEPSKPSGSKAPTDSSSDETDMAEFDPESSEIEDMIQKLTMSAMPKELEEASSTTEQASAVEEIGKKVSGDPGLFRDAREAVKSYDRTLHLIYERYNGNPDKTMFRNKVERMALINMMLLFQKELGFGKVLSNLYQLLLDLVQYLDADETKLMESVKDFMRKKSLTLYFDDAYLRRDEANHSGISALRQTLQVQAENSLQNIVTFVSDLRGIKYLMDSVRSNPRAEVIVVNATAEEFLAWIHEENTKEGAEIQRLRFGGLVTTTVAREAKSSDTVIPPALVYMSDIAFTETCPKAKWIAQVSGLTAKDERLAFTLPPLCISSASQNVVDWAKDAIQLATDAEAVPAPVLVLGPSPNLNPSGDGFPTVLPAGYVFAAHLLARPNQRLNIPGVKRASAGRFRVIGAGFAEMSTSLDQVLWGESKGDRFSFAADFYLYVLLNLLATPSFSEKGPFDANDFLRMFSFEVGDPQTTDRYRTTEALGPALVGGNAHRFKLVLENNSFVKGVVVAPDSKPLRTLLHAQVEPFEVQHVVWFEKVLSQLFPGREQPRHPVVTK
jgi:hypothetical protein